MKIKKVVVCGGGILGSQIAFQSAYCGYDVTILIRKEDSIEDVQTKLKNLKQTYLDTIDHMNPRKTTDPSWARGISEAKGFDKNLCKEKAKIAFNTLKVENNQKTALSKADLVIESITENRDVKNAFY